MIGNNIRKIRKQKKLTQEKLARLSNISLNTLTKIESGFAKAPNIKTIVKISKALGVSVDRLVENYLKNEKSLE
ncbi:MAG: helix-turn-helix domain-containing protein [Candidatus Omnitrophica bacterium]|nr:helix-turn-helix domain-containing protein [Candidatus Omnitrophota bacterium]